MAQEVFYIVGFLLLVFVMLLLGSIKIVPQAEEWMLEYFGRFYRVLGPGVHFFLPLIYRVSFKMNLREKVLDIPPQHVISKDNAIVTVDGVAFYRIFDSKRAAYQVENLTIAMTQLIMTNIRTVLGEMELDEMLSNREVLNKKLLAVIDEATDPWGIKVIRVEIKDIIPEKGIAMAMSAQTKAERIKRAAVLEAQGKREAAILQANGQKDSAILHAQGDQEAKILAAQAEKERAFLIASARERAAEAEAKAIEMVSSALKKGDQEAAQFLLSQKYIQSLQELAGSENSKTVFMPFESAKVAGSLGMLTELVKQTMQPDSKQPKKAAK